MSKGLLFYDDASREADRLNEEVKGRGICYWLIEATSSRSAEPEYYLSCYCEKHDRQVLEGDSCGQCLLEAGRMWDCVAGKSVEDPQGRGWAIYHAVTADGAGDGWGIRFYRWMLG